MSSFDNILKKDKKLFAVVKHVNKVLPNHKNNDIYFYLQESIVSQQLSFKVARVIWERYLKLFDKMYPHPEQLISFEIEHLRSVGLSQQKASYLKNTAEFNMSNPLTGKFLSKLDDEDVVKYLTQIKGVGRWTAQMVLMFPLDRPDIFPVDDLGIQIAMKKVYGIEAEKKELRHKLLEISEKWKPHRTVASKYLWAYRD